MSEAYDIIVVGGGSLVWQQVFTAHVPVLKTIILQKEDTVARQLPPKSWRTIRGFPGEQPGRKLTMEAMAKHAESFGTEISNEEVVELDLDGEIKVVKTKAAKTIVPRALSLLLGLLPGTLNIKGEQELGEKSLTVPPVMQTFSKSSMWLWSVMVMLQLKRLCT